MDFVLFDDAMRSQLFPFTHTRPVASLRVGILTIQEKWNYYLKATSNFHTAAYLMAVFNEEGKTSTLYINGSVLPTAALVEGIQSLKANEILVKGDTVIAVRFEAAPKRFDIKKLENSTIKRRACEYTIEKIIHPWDIFSKNDAQIQSDFEILTADKQSQEIPAYVTAIHPENIFIEEGAVLNPCIINATNAKVYVGKSAEIMEGCMLRGNIAICDHAVLKMGAKVYSGTTIGPGCKVGGEVQNVVFYANSNKGHDGYLGNAVIGEWCNLGADTNCSNLKNDYRMVEVYSEAEGKYLDTGLQFCGLLMGDHSKCSINSMFNTGTVVGVSCNIFGTEFPPKYIPSFTWGGSTDAVPYRIDKAMAAANRMMERRRQSLNTASYQMFAYIYNLTH